MWVGSTNVYELSVAFAWTMLYCFAVTFKMKRIRLQNPDFLVQAVREHLGVLDRGTPLIVHAA
jgi:hypothetical protein